MAKKTIVLTTSIELIDKQRELAAEALGPDGIYIKMKETLQELMDKGEFKGDDKARIISEVISSMTSTITNSTMGTALQWAAQEKDLALRKAELEYRLDILDNESNKGIIEIDTATAQKQLAQATILRDFGTPVTNGNGDIVSLSDEGTKWEVIKNTQEDTANKVKQGTQLVAQTEQVFATTHKTVADTYVNHGMFTWTDITETGITGAAKTVDSFVTLSDLNKEVAREQAKGYTFNAWSNAATSSASMVGTLIAAEIPGLDTTPYLNIWKDSVTQLTTLVAPTITV